MHSYSKLPPFCSCMDIMGSCLLNLNVTDEAELYDHRYLYVDSSSIGHYTCGLARDTMAKMLRHYGQSKFFLSNAWLTRMEEFRGNPVILGFLVEQACLSSISMHGLHVRGLDVKNMTTIVFQGYPMYDLSHDLALYIPLTFNFKAIDGLILSLDKVNMVAHLIPIQVTISQRHSDSESKFFENWSNWISGLGSYSANATFLWITKASGPISNKVAYTVRYRSIWVSVEEVNIDISNHLD